MHVQHLPLEEPRILVAEDDPHLRRLIARRLGRNGYQVLEAGNGIEALELLARIALNRTELAAVILDVRMPGHTGLAILSGLRDRAKEIPIVLMTAFGDVELHRRAAELGARAVLDKPFAMEALVRAVQAPAGPTVDEREESDAYIGDRMLLERYLDVVNRARVQQAFRRSDDWYPSAILTPISIRITGAGAPSCFIVEWQARDGYVLSTECTEVAVVQCEVPREHADAVVARPWRYIAEPQQLALWFLIHRG
jgi:two-component system response regulator (stage 0 sporulation protein F)